VRVISRAAIREFSRKHPDALEPLLHWYCITQRAEWSSPAEVRNDFRHAGFVGKYTVFDIAGNRYRLIATVKYRWRIVYIRSVLTHREYEEEDWKK
jgi:mRNA interferase HigB